MLLLMNCMINVFEEVGFVMCLFDLDDVCKVIVMIMFVGNVLIVEMWCLCMVWFS